MTVALARIVQAEGLIAIFLRESADRGELVASIAAATPPAPPADVPSVGRPIHQAPVSGAGVRTVDLFEFRL
jgi:hypothetical protein